MDGTPASWEEPVSGTPPRFHPTEPRQTISSKLELFNPSLATEQSNWEPLELSGLTLDVYIPLIDEAQEQRDETINQRDGLTGCALDSSVLLPQLRKQRQIPTPKHRRKQARPAHRCRSKGLVQKENHQTEAETKLRAEEKAEQVKTEQEPEARLQRDEKRQGEEQPRKKKKGASEVIMTTEQFELDGKTDSDGEGDGRREVRGLISHSLNDCIVVL